MYGMSDRFGMMCLATVEHQYLNGAAGLICGEDTAGQIDEEVLALINTCYSNAYNMLQENKDVLDKISEYLFEKETITGKEFMKMYRELKGIPEPVEEVKEEKQPEGIFEEDEVVVEETFEKIELVDDYFEED